MFEQISCIYIHETDRAVLVDAGLGEDLWIPKSVIEDFDNYSYEKGDDIEISVAAWFCEKNDLY